LALQNTGVKEALVTAVNEGRYNNGLTSMNSNPQQRRFIENNAAGGTGIPA